MFIDSFILNGAAHGQVAESLAGCYFDPNLMRPYIDSSGRRCVTINTRKVDAKGKPIFERRLIADLINSGISNPVFNSTSLRKEEWIELDRVVLRAARQRLRAVTDLGSNGLTYGGFNGMAKTILEHETMNDPGEAIVDMDGITTGRSDAPLFQLQGLPLPITHVDFWFPARKLMASRNSGTPLDTTMAESAGRRVAEMIEKTLIGVETGLTYGGGSTTPTYGRTASVYGYTNFPDRITKTDLTTPTGSNPNAIIADVLEMRELLYNNRFYGPFMVYHSTAYDRFLDDDYYLTGGATTAMRTVRERLKAIENIVDVRRLDFLTDGYVLIMVQLTPDVVRLVNGMDITTVQWESKGGMQLNFKVMAIQVPQIRADYNGRSGIVHGTTA